MGFYNVSWVLVLSLQSSNTAGMTKKSFVSVSIAIFYCEALLRDLLLIDPIVLTVCLAVGNIVGPQFFRTSQAPTYRLGIGAMLCCFAIMGATGIVYGVLVNIENKRRDRLFGLPGKDRVTLGLEIEALDQTDGQNTEFRYVN